MTLEKLLEELTFNNITLQDAYSEVTNKDNKKSLNYFINRNSITSDPLSTREIQDLQALVGILQILYNSAVGSPIEDSEYDTLQELLVTNGIPRLTGSIEINSNSKLDHRYTTLRGSLDKIYYLTNDEKRKNPSRKYLDEWIKTTENIYKKSTKEDIDLNECKVMLQNKFDGVSCICEVDSDGKILWLTRGDTYTNKASDVSHIMNIFDDLYQEYRDTGIKFEVCMTEENLAKINTLVRDPQYKNSRQVVTSVLNSNIADFKADYIYPIPLRIIRNDQDIEQIHPDLISKFPTLVCKLGERDVIRKFANQNKWVLINGMRFRTDGVVITILDPKVQKALGRDRNINNFEVALKNSEESAVARVRDVIFETSQFGFISPVLEIYPIILKGNTITRCSLSNKERFDELMLSYGDTVKISYDIIPVVAKDEDCTKNKTGRRIEFITRCPKCKEELDLSVKEVQCHNPKCESRLIGRIWNYCQNLRVQNIGYNTLEALFNAGLLKKGIYSLYKLRKKTFEMEELDGFGKLRTRKIISEIENKRRIKDYEFFGSIGMESLSMRTFQTIFSKVKYSEFISMIKNKNFDLLYSSISLVDGMGEKKSELMLRYLKDNDFREETLKLLEELSIEETYGSESNKGRIVFSGFRSDELAKILESKGWTVTDGWSNKTSYLVVKNLEDTSSKIEKARKASIPIITEEYALSNLDNL